MKERERERERERESLYHIFINEPARDPRARRVFFSSTKLIRWHDKLRRIALINLPESRRAIDTTDR